MTPLKSSTAMAPVRPVFTVVIPTLQKSALLRPMVGRYCLHPLVGEVLVINNSSNALTFNDPKVRVLQQQQNIFVNPAWNLGAAEARFPFLAIANDDLLFDPRLFDITANWLKRCRGIIGPDSSCFSKNRRRNYQILMPVFERRFGYGALMFMNRESYVPIPEDMLILHGDDYLFYNQLHRNYAFRGFSIETPMSVTAGRPEFTPRLRSDQVAYNERYSDKPLLRRYRIESFLHRHAWKMYRLLMHAMSKSVIPR